MDVRWNQKLRVLRQTRGLSKTALAKAIEVEDETVGRWERGQNDPRRTDMVALARFFKITMDELWNDDVPLPQTLMVPIEARLESEQPAAVRRPSRAVRRAASDSAKAAAEDDQAAAQAAQRARRDKHHRGQARAG